MVEPITIAVCTGFGIYTAAVAVVTALFIHQDIKNDRKEEELLRKFR